jgi:GTP-dependent phosphoenolpyruvate carboxykinase
LRRPSISLRKNRHSDAAGREDNLGDDITYFRNIDGEFWAVNVESGIFGM